MKVSIDYDRCMGDGECCKMCPEVFAYDEDKTEASVKIADVPPELQEKVRQTAAKCDTEAIVIEE